MAAELQRVPASPEAWQLQYGSCDGEFDVELRSVGDHHRNTNKGGKDTLAAFLLGVCKENQCLAVCLRTGVSEHCSGRYLSVRH